MNAKKWICLGDSYTIVDNKGHEEGRMVNGLFVPCEFLREQDARDYAKAKGIDLYKTIKH